MEDRLIGLTVVLIVLSEIEPRKKLEDVKRRGRVSAWLAVPIVTNVHFCHLFPLKELNVPHNKFGGEKLTSLSEGSTRF